MAEKIIQNIVTTIEKTASAVQKRVVCLYRVSTLGQVDKDDIPMQKQCCREFCRRQSGWTIVREFAEKGVSGFKVSAKDRDAIQDIQKMALNGEFDILLVFMFDRLGRRDDETPFVVEWFVKQNIEVWSAMEGQQRFDSHVDKLLNYIRYWQASGESIKTSLRVKTRLEQLTEDGFFTGGRAPFGYQAVKKGRMNKKNQEVRDLAIEPSEAEVVTLIFQKYVYEGYGALRICRYLADRGIPGRNGKNVTVAVVNRVLRNPIYTGVLQHGESQSKVVLPELRLIDADLFMRAQEILRERSAHRKAQTEHNSEVPFTTRGQSLLVGNVYCGHCGAKLTLATAGRSYRKKDGTLVKKTYPCYKCYNKAMSPGKCDGQTTYGTTVLDNLVDQIIRIQLERIQHAPPQALLQKQHDREVSVAKAKVKLLNDQYQQKQRDYQDLRAETLKVIQGTSRLNVDLLNSLVDETTAQLKELEGQVQTAETELREIVSGAEQVRQEYAQVMNWAELYDNCTFEAKKMIAAQFVKAVRVKRGYEMDVEFNVSFEEFQKLYLEPETEEEKKTRADMFLSFVEKPRQVG